MKSARAGLTVLCAVLYPAVVYFAYDAISPRGLAGILILLLLTRLGFAFFRDETSKIPWRALLPFAVISFIAAIIVFVAQSNELLLHVPVIVQMLLFCAFLWSYIRKPTIIEGFAEMDFPVLPPIAISYCRKVTLLWCGVFVLNALATEWIIFNHSREVWLAWTSLGIYLWMGFVFLLEFLVRKNVEPKFAEALAEMEATPKV